MSNNRQSLRQSRVEKKVALELYDDHLDGEAAGVFAFEFAKMTSSRPNMHAQALPNDREQSLIIKGISLIRGSACPRL